MNPKVASFLLAGTGAAIAVGLLCFALAPVADAPQSDVRSEAGESAASGNAARLVGEVASAKVAHTARAAKRNGKPQLRAPVDWFEKLPAKDRVIAKRIQDAQDADDREAMFNAAEDALGSANPEVREAAVDSLRTLGEETIPLLLRYVGDKNPDVAEAAYNAWDDAVDELHGDHKKLEAIETLLPLLASKERVASAVEKIAALDRSLAIQELTKLAQGNGRAADAAKESFETLTGVSFENRIEVEVEEAADMVNRLENAEK